MTRSWKKIVTSFYRSLLFFWHHSENWVFLKTVPFHFQSIKWALTLNDAKLWLGRSLTRAVSAQSFKISCSSRNGFWLVYEDLSIDFGRMNLLQNRDMACKLGCRLFLSPQLYIRLTMKIWLVESIQSIHNSLWTWHDKWNICCRYCIYHVEFNVCLVTKPLGVFSSETKWLNASLRVLRIKLCEKCMIKQSLNSVFAWYHELSKPRVCVICLSLRLRQITQTSVLIINY